MSTYKNRCIAHTVKGDPCKSWGKKDDDGKVRCIAHSKNKDQRRVQTAGRKRGAAISNYKQSKGRLVPTSDRCKDADVELSAEHTLLDRTAVPRLLDAALRNMDSGRWTPQQVQAVGAIARVALQFHDTEKGSDGVSGQLYELFKRLPSRVKQDLATEMEVN